MFMIFIEMSTVYNMYIMYELSVELTSVYKNPQPYQVIAVFNCLNIAFLNVLKGKYKSINYQYNVFHRTDS